MLELDSEVLDQVLRRLSAEDVARVGSTCQHLRQQIRTGDHALQLWRSHCRELLGDLVVAFVAAGCQAGTAATWQQLYSGARMLDVLHWSPAAPAPADLALVTATISSSRGSATSDSGAVALAAAQQQPRPPEPAALLARTGHTATAAGRLLVLIGGDLRDGPAAPSVTDVTALDLATGRVLQPRLLGRQPPSLRQHCTALMTLQPGSALHEQVTAAVLDGSAAMAGAPAAARQGGPVRSSPSRRAAEALALQGHTLAVFGGLRPDGTEQPTWQEQLHVLWLHPAGTWAAWLHPATSGPGPEPRAYACCQAIGGGARLLVTGGWVHGSIAGTSNADVSLVDGHLLMCVYILDQADLTWARVPTRPLNEPPRPGHVMVGPSTCPGPRKQALTSLRTNPATGHEEYLLLGGCGMDGLADLVPYVLDVETFIWSKAAVVGYLPPPRGPCAVARLTDTWLLLLGGCDQQQGGGGGGGTAAVERLHLPSLSWRPPPQLLAPAQHHHDAGHTRHHDHSSCASCAPGGCGGRHHHGGGVTAAAAPAGLGAGTGPAAAAAATSLKEPHVWGPTGPSLPAAGCAAAVGVVVGGSWDGPYGPVLLPSLHVLLPGPPIPAAQPEQQQPGGAAAAAAAAVAVREAAAAAACNGPFAHHTGSKNEAGRRAAASPGWHAATNSSCSCGSCCGCLAAKAAAAGSMPPSCCDPAGAAGQRGDVTPPRSQPGGSDGSGGPSHRPGGSNGSGSAPGSQGGGGCGGAAAWRPLGPDGKAVQVLPPVGWLGELEIEPAPPATQQQHQQQHGPLPGRTATGGSAGGGSRRLWPAAAGSLVPEWQQPGSSTAANLGGVLVQVCCALLVLLLGLLLMPPSLDAA